MDVEKTMQFILDHQAKFEAGMEELRQAQRKTEQGLDRLQRLVEAYAQAGSIQMQLHRERMDAHEAWMRESGAWMKDAKDWMKGADSRFSMQEVHQKARDEEFQAFLKRFDDFIRRQHGSKGH